MNGYHRAAATVLLASVIGAGVRGFRFSDGFPAMAAPFPAMAAPAAKQQVAAKRQVAVKSNDPCYVCHMPFIKEDLAVVHAKVHVWCGTCHGPSVAHVEDEHIGVTPPDVVFKKGRVDRMCSECHDPQEHTPLTEKTRRARLAEGKKAQREIKRRKVQVAGVCTDCHGRHWIPPREQERPPGEKDQAGARD